jgi:hypothetical protein
VLEKRRALEKKRATERSEKRVSLPELWYMTRHHLPKQLAFSMTYLGLQSFQPGE